MLTFWFLIVLLVSLVICAIVSTVAASKGKGVPGTGFVAFFLYIAIIVVSVNIYNVARAIDRLSP